jgi:hypothetical protein
MRLAFRQCVWQRRLKHILFRFWLVHWAIALHTKNLSSILLLTFFLWTFESGCILQKVSQLRSIKSKKYCLKFQVSMVWIDKILGLTIDLVSILFYNSEIKPHKQKLVRLGKPSSIERGDHLKWLIRKIGFHLPWTIAIKFTILLFLQSLFCFSERIVPKYSGNSMVPPAFLISQLDLITFCLDNFQRNVQHIAALQALWRPGAMSFHIIKTYKINFCFIPTCGALKSFILFWWGMS